MDKNAKIYIAGHRGLAGSAIMRELERQGFANIVVRTHAELDLEDASTTLKFFEQEKPEVVFLAAARVGGIHANNTYPVDFLSVRGWFSRRGLCRRRGRRLRLRAASWGWGLIRGRRS